jgi:hypothetical protein
VATARLLPRDVERLAKCLGVSQGRFLSGYTERTEDEGLVLRREESGDCVFLSGNECTVYDDRPASCRDFPHLIRGAGSLESRMWAFIDRAVYCPIVFNTLEAWKVETEFKPRPS